MIHFSQLRRHLPEFSDAWLKPLDECARDYVRYYDINFDEKIAGLTQSIGCMQSADFELVVQSFILSTQAPTIFACHGYFDHSGLYGKLIEWGLKRGYNLILFDLPGHGLSSGSRASIDSFDSYIEALNSLVLWCSPRLLGDKLLLGQSTGAAVVMSYLMTKPNNIQHAVLLAPLVRPHKWSRIKWLHRIVRPFLSRLPRTFTDNSHDEDFLRRLKMSDPLQCRTQSIRWVTAMSQWMRWFLTLKPVSNTVLVIQGTADLTVDWRYNLHIIGSKFPRASIVKIDNMRHHVVGEHVYYREQVFASIDSYLYKKSATETHNGAAQIKG